MRRDRALGARRRRAALLALVFALASAPGCGDRPDATERAFGVQLHTHGSMSEGPASMRAHAFAAEALGGAVDAIWWTDHDWRIAAHTYVTGFDFEAGLEEHERAPAPMTMSHFDGRLPFPEWSRSADVGPGAPADSVERVRKAWVPRNVPDPAARVRMVVSDREARSGEKSLHLSVQAPPKTRDRLVLGFETTRRRHIASLASGVTLRLAVLPAVVSGDARLILRVGLSQQRPREHARIDYVLAPADGGAARVSEVGDEARRVRVATIPVPTEPGRWNDWVLDVSGDAERHGLGGADNSLSDVSLAIEVGPGAQIEAWIDAFGIERARVGPPLFAAERELARSLTTDALTHHVGQEISYAAHLNAYGMRVPLVDSAAHPHGLTPTEAVEWAHRHGGLVSLNHFFGTESTMISHRFPRSRVAFEASLASLIAQRAFGVDLLEVGYRSRGHGLEAFVELWDGLSRAGIRLVGIGASDSHDAEQGWARGPNNFLTWIYAASVAERDLLAGLAAGRAFFGDPTRFFGELDIETDGGERMGDVVEVGPERGSVRVWIVARGLTSGQRVRVVRDGEVIGRHAGEGADLRAPYSIDVRAATFVRSEVVENDEVIALGNPIHFVPRGRE